jgi:NitT/TauT family transport system substrate-binding protein
MMRAVVALAVLIALGCGCAEKRAVQVVEPLTIAVGALPQYSLIQVAQVKGFFAAEGLSITLQHHASGKLSLASLLAGKADLATASETPVVFAELAGKRLSVLASTATSTKNVAVVVRKASGILRPADLEGKQIGVPTGTSADFFLDTFLLRHSMARSAVRIVELGPSEMEQALASGLVDAVAIWNPTALVQHPRVAMETTLFYEEELYAETSLIVGRRGFGTERPETARRVLRALLRAEALFLERPAEARSLVAAAMLGAPGQIDQMLRQFDFRVRLDQSLLVLMEEEARWVHRTGKATRQGASSFLETMEPAPLLAVMPERVGLIR